MTGVLDWEFAHSGHPFTDLGNVLRFDRHPEYVAGVLSAWESRRGTPADQALDLARAADLFALIDLAARSGANPVATSAAALLHAIVDADDWHAAPALVDPRVPEAREERLAKREDGRPGAAESVPSERAESD